MVFFKLGFHLWKSKRFSNILLIILMAMSLFMISICVGILNNQFSMFRAMRKFDKAETYYYMCNTIDDMEILAYDEAEKTGVMPDVPTFEEYLAEITDNVGVKADYLYMETVPAYQGNKETYEQGVTYVAVSNAVGEKLNAGGLKEGKWFTDAPKQEGILNVVALEGGYNVGDKFNLCLFSGNFNDEGYPLYDKVVCLVTGVLPSGADMLLPGEMNTKAQLNTLLKKLSSDVENGLMSVLYFSYEDSAVQAYRKNMNICHTCFIYKDTSAKESDIQKTFTNMKKYGWLLNFDEIYGYSYETVYEQVAAVLPFLVGIFLMTVVCLMCIMVLNSADYLKTYSVYYLCGMNWSDMRKILLSYSLIMVFGAGVLTGIIHMATTMADTFGGMTVTNGYTLLAVCGVAVLIVTVMVFVPYRMLAKSSPKQALTEN